MIVGSSQLFEGPFYGEFQRHYSIAPDGQSFLMLTAAEDGGPAGVTGELVVVENWIEDVKRKVD